MSQMASVSNPFAGPAKATASSALVEAESQRAIAETQAAVLMAKRFPRDQKQAMDRILIACTRPGLAESATYSYGRGGSDVTGPSIRLAETIAQMWGNLQFGIRELSQANGESEVEAFAWDIETNTRQVKVFKVPHERHTKTSVKKLTDPRDIYELVANNGARRLRACILGIIPGDVVESAVNQCDVTLKAKVEITPDLIKKTVEAFAEFGVTKEMIEARIQRRIDAVTPALIVNLRKIYNSLKDGMASPSDFFSEPDQAHQSSKPELPDYSDEEFESNLPAWSKLIASGKKTAEQIIATVESKGRLSNDQKAKLMDVKAAPVTVDVKAAPVTVDAKTGEEGVPQCSQEEFAAKLPEWTAVLQSGKRTAEQLIVNIETKCWLTEAQKTQLRGIK